MKNSRDVNKMGVREYDYIRGNTALAPDKKIKETEKQRKKQRIQSKKRVVLAILGPIAFAISVWDGFQTRTS